MRQLSFWDETVYPLSPEVNVKRSSPDKIDAECKTDSGKAALQCRKSAAALQKQIDAKHHSANSLLLQFPTRKRLSDAASFRREAVRLEQVQATLQRLADMHDEGRIPSELARVNSRGAVESALFNSAMDSTIRMLYNSAGRDERRDERILRMTQEALLQNIPGYFPTPEPLAQQLVELADIQPGNRVWEPEAGSGHLMDVVRKRHPEIELFYCEVNCFLLEILREKYESAKTVHFIGRDAFEVASTRTEHPFDRIIMNPPFERGQDAEHVQYAFSLIAPDGILAAVISPGILSRKDGKAKQFREFLQKTRALVHDIPAGAFKSSGTNVGSKIVYVRAPAQ